MRMVPELVEGSYQIDRAGVYSIDGSLVVTGEFANVSPSLCEHVENPLV